MVVNIKLEKPIQYSTGIIEVGSVEDAEKIYEAAKKDSDFMITFGDYQFLMIFNEMSAKIRNGEILIKNYKQND